MRASVVAMFDVALGAALGTALRVALRKACRIALRAAFAATATVSFAQRPPSQTAIVAPVDRGAVRLRWPETTLAPAAVGSVVSIDDAAGLALPFTFAIAPEDQGHAMHPLWLIVRLDGNAPYRLTVGLDARGRFVDTVEAAAGRPAGSLSTLPLAVVRADAWGPITATLEDAQTAQQSRDTRWRRAIIALALACAAIVGAVATFFSRYQAQRHDLPKR